MRARDMDGQMWMWLFVEDAKASLNKAQILCANGANDEVYDLLGEIIKKLDEEIG